MTTTGQSPSLANTTALLDEWLHAPGLSMLRGAQVCVHAGGIELDLALGETGTGQPMTPDTIFRVYCTIKPMTALAVAQLVDDGDLELDTPLGAVIRADETAVPRATVRQVLSHTAGLHRVSTLAMELLPQHIRDRRIAQTRQPDGWAIGRDAGYSEYVGWHLLGRVLERVTGQPLRDHLRAAVLDPLEMSSTWIGMPAHDYERNAERLGLNWALRGSRSVPLLLERAERWCTEVNCASGGYSTACDLARCYARLVARLNGHHDPSLPSPATLDMFCRPARPRGYDVVLERECDYGLGFMVNLSDHFFGSRCSERSFGHTGLAGSSFAFGDATNQVAGAVILNGIVEGSPAVLRREALVEALYDDLDIAACQPRCSEALASRQ